jgi:hypothetical protein
VSAEWPAWLQDWIKSYQAELDYENGHRDLAIFDDEYFEAKRVRLNELPRPSSSDDAESGDIAVRDFVDLPLNEWGDKPSAIRGFSFMDPRWVMVHEKQFERHLAYLCSLPPEKKAQRRALDARNDKKYYPNVGLRGCRYSTHLYEDRFEPEGVKVAPVVRVEPETIAETDIFAERNTFENQLDLKNALTKLSPRELRILEMYKCWDTQAEIAAKEGLTERQIRRIFASIRSNVLKSA